MRFAWAINPRNYLLFACHASNEAVQLNQMRRVLSVQDWNKVRVCGAELAMSKASVTNICQCCRAWSLTKLRHIWIQLIPTKVNVPLAPSENRKHEATARYWVWAHCLSATEVRCSECHLWACSGRVYQYICRRSWHITLNRLPVFHPCSTVGNLPMAMAKIANRCTLTSKVILHCFSWFLTHARIHLKHTVLSST